jgi:hypothetical protein
MSILETARNADEWTASYELRMRLSSDTPSPHFSVRRAKAQISNGCESHPATVAPAGSNRSGDGGNEVTEAYGVEGRYGDLASMQAVT